MDEQRLNTLLVARGLLDRGQASADGTPPGAMAAVVLFDLAVETAGKAVRAAHLPSRHPGTGYLEKQGELGKRVKGDLRFQRMLDDLVAALRIKAGDDDLALLERERIVWLHNFRNGVQHDANEPAASDIQRAGVYATDFVDALLRSFYETSLAKLSRASLVQDEEVREAIRAAEERGARRDFNTAMERLAVAFELARSAFRTGEPYRRRLSTRRSDLKRALSDFASHPGASSSGGRQALQKVLQAVLPAVKPKPTHSSVNAIVDAVFPRKSGDPRRLERVLADLGEGIERAEERLEAVAVAGDPSEYAWFSRRVPRPTPHWAGEDKGLSWHTIPPEPPADEREYLRALEFVTNTALRWQQFPEPERSEEKPDDDALEALAYEL